MVAKTRPSTNGKLGTSVTLAGPEQADLCFWHATVKRHRISLNMSGQTEHDLVKAFVNIIASQPVTFHDDFQEQPEKTVKIAPVVQVKYPSLDIIITASPPTC